MAFMLLNKLVYFNTGQRRLSEVLPRNHPSPTMITMIIVIILWFWGDNDHNCGPLIFYQHCSYSITASTGRRWSISLHRSLHVTNLVPTLQTSCRYHLGDRLEHGGTPTPTGVTIFYGNSAWALCFVWLSPSHDYKWKQNHSDEWEIWEELEFQFKKKEESSTCYEFVAKDIYNKNHNFDVEHLPLWCRCVGGVWESEFLFIVLPHLISYTFSF